MKNTFTLFILLVLGLNLSAQEQYSRARISLKDRNISDLAAIGVDVNEGFYQILQHYLIKRSLLY